MLWDCRAAYLGCVEVDHALDEVRGRPCPRLSRSSSSLHQPCSSSRVPGNWEEIKYEISLSNVIQRDSSIFARKLDKSLDTFAAEKDQEVKIDFVRIRQICVDCPGQEL